MTTKCQMNINNLDQIFLYIFQTQKGLQCKLFCLILCTDRLSCIMRNHGTFFDESISMNDHVNRVVRSCFYKLRHIKSIHRSLPIATVIQLVNYFVKTRVDYCNNVLTGLPSYQLDHIQSVLNVAARLIYGRGRFDHVIPLLASCATKNRFQALSACLQSTTQASTSIYC